MKNICICAVTPNLKRGQTELMVVGTGKLAYLWIGAEDAYYGYIDNSAKLRKFLRSALKRMEATPK
jgi:hypothetical protein